MNSTSGGRSTSYPCAFWVPKIAQPSSRIDLRQNSVDLPLLRTYANATTLAGNRGLHSSYTDTLDGKRALSRNPADDDGIASVPEIQDLERNIGLGSLGGEKFCFGCECQDTELRLLSVLWKSSRHMSFCAYVLSSQSRLMDQCDDAVGLIGKVVGKELDC